MATNRNEAQFERYRDWQWIKHLVFRDYPKPWSAKVGSTAREVYVADVCAGAGTYTDKRTGKKYDGSPVIFATRALEYVQKHPNRLMQVICVERNQRNFVALEKRLSGFGDLVIVRHGDFARHTDFICDTIGDAPALILIDPIGLKAIPAAMCSPLIHRRGKTDVFLILHLKVIHRTGGQLILTGEGNPLIPGAEHAAQTIDAALATSAWRRIALGEGSAETKERAYLSLYFQNVLGNRYRWKCAYPVRSRSTSSVQYWLVHASNHLDAFLLMNDEMVKLDQRLHVATYDDPDALPGFAESEYEAHAETAQAQLERQMVELVANAPGGVLPFGCLRDELLTEFFGRVKQGAYGTAVRNLVKQGRLEREERVAARFELTERISLPRPPIVVPGRANVRAA